MLWSRTGRVKRSKQCGRRGAAYAAGHCVNGKLHKGNGAAFRCVRGSTVNLKAAASANEGASQAVLHSKSAGSPFRRQTLLNKRIKPPQLSPTQPGGFQFVFFFRTLSNAAVRTCCKLPRAARLVAAQLKQGMRRLRRRHMPERPFGAFRRAARLSYVTAL